MNLLYKIVVKKLMSEKNGYKSNAPMPPRTKKNIDNMVEEIKNWKSEHKEKALKFVNEIGHKNLFEILHSMRRWYSGQTMASVLIKNRKHLKKVMELEPEDTIGIFRGFKVPRDDEIASYEKGKIFNLDIKRNKGFSSWTVSQKEAHKFSGKTKEKVGVVVELVGEKNAKPVLAPKNKTKSWFNALYEKIIGKSYRIKEKEYLLYGSPLKVKIVEIKK